MAILVAHRAGSVHFGIGIETIFLAPPKDKKTLKIIMIIVSLE